jgi:hypothetical protein
MNLPEVSEFTYRGYGRIYVLREEDLELAEKLLRNSDPYEYEMYGVPNLITTADNYPHVIYLHKYEPKLRVFRELCKENNLPVVIFDSGEDSDPQGIKILLSREDISGYLGA